MNLEQKIEMYKYLPNIFVVIFFMLLNPLYALAICALISITTERVNNLLVGILYVFSFSLFFANQEFLLSSDIGSYTTMYVESEYRSIKDIFEVFIKTPNGQEVLWRIYLKNIGFFSNFNLEIFVLTTYILIFTLSAYLVKLVTNNERYNYALMLFSLILFETTFLDSTYDLWRNIIAILVCLISISKYFSHHSILGSRVLLYSSSFIHLSMILIILIFEAYIFLVYRKESYNEISKLFLFKNAIFVVGIVTGVMLMSYLVANNISLSGSLEPAIIKYRQDEARSFNFLIYFRPFYILAFLYAILNWRGLKSFDYFLLVAFLIIESLTYSGSEFSIAIGRASILTKIGLLFIAIKLIDSFNFKYIIGFIFAIFSLRIIIFANGSSLPFLENIAQGGFLNPIYGLTNSIFYFYNPLFIGF